MYYKQGPNQWDVAKEPYKTPYVTSPKDEWEKHLPKDSKPKPPTLADVFPNFDRWSIGLDPFFTSLESIKTAKAPSYPPYNVIRTGENYVIEMAVAGFKKDDIEITVKDRTLTIASCCDLVLGEDKVREVNKQKNVEVVHNGIASRSFTTNFALGEYIEVTEATMEDGILTVFCNNIVPDEKKPKTIAIS
jgi:molecular chaperone IbpA